MLTSTSRIPLSVLDLSSVGEDQTSSEALAATTRLARRADELGYRRFWVAEHHNMPAVASTSPAVLIAHLAAATEQLRVGSGGVMLPNHPSLVVAEQFAMLEALHPGRVDLGIGRAPGTDPTTAAALRRTPEGLGAEDFPQELENLLALLGDPSPDGSAPDGARQTQLAATPARVSAPPVWLLGSSGYSAQAAGVLGLPFSFAHHFSAGNTEPALDLYRRSFRPSAVLDRPYAMVCQAVLVADSAERAEWLAGPGRLMQLSLRTGKPRPLPSPEDAAAHTWTDQERDLLARWPSRPSIGDPGTVVDELSELADRTGADELMVTSSVYGAEDRLRSFELLAQAW